MSSIETLVYLLGICLGCLRGVCDSSAWRQGTQISADVMAGKTSFVDFSGAPQNELMTAYTAPSFNSIPCNPYSDVLDIHTGHLVMHSPRDFPAPSSRPYQKLYEQGMTR